MRPIRTISISPSLPASLHRLLDLAHNLYWAWHEDAVDLFRRIDRERWEANGHNPVRMLGQVSQERLDELTSDPGFHAQYERVIQAFDDYLTARNTWYRRRFPDLADRSTRIGYFSFEFGLAESLPLYSGGMGVLAGDHLKSASDLDVPLIGVSLAYQEGYFRQYLNADGWQGETYADNDFHTMPMQLARGPDGAPIKVAVSYPGREVHAQIWRINVGRCPLILLDTNLEENPPADRLVTRRLYGGDTDMRIRQEILLGMGGLRALDALDWRPTVCHMNEGHAAFLGLERIRQLVVERNLTFAEAREAAAAGNAFTTHTPVPAGIDVFPPELIDQYLDHLYGQLGISRDEFLALGRQNQVDGREHFSMAVLAIRLAARVNGVSKLHGEVSRRMWSGMWPELPLPEVPIGAITNGVHCQTWVDGHDMAELYDRYLGPRWREDPTDEDVWAAVPAIPSEELWRAHEYCRERLVAYVRQQVRRQRVRRGAPASEVERASEILSPEALTIGFARRFAAYKRALLLFSDPQSLARILGNRERRVQIVVAGKAHPQDRTGREIIRDLIHKVRENELEHQVIFVEDYDLELARYLVQGVDLWLANSRRPLEASGTSGMKVAMNGGLNVGVLDGWWSEAYDPRLGWTIGQGEEYEDPEYQDQIESRALYELLEKEIIPTFYDRGADGLPRQWIDRMKTSIARLSPYFNTHRMVRDYSETAYGPLAQRSIELTADNLARARSLAAWRRAILERWPKLQIASVEAETPADVRVGSTLQVTTRLRLDEIAPDEVKVEIFYGPVDGNGELGQGAAVAEAGLELGEPGLALYRGVIPCRTSGLWGYAVRVRPRHPDLDGAIDPGPILWAR